MGATKIEWTDLSSNPLRYKDADGNDVWACVKKSTGCANCYSESLALRYGKGTEFTAANMRTLTPYLRTKELRELLSTKKTPAGSKVFLGDMTDIFGDWVPDGLLDELLGVLAIRHDVTFQVLTKRPGRMAAYFAGQPGMRMLVSNSRYSPFDNAALKRGADYDLGHVWFGTSVENQQAADERIPYLLQVPAAVRFLSCEPLLGPLDLSKWLVDPMLAEMNQHYGIVGRIWRPSLHWAIVGGESGPDSRACRVEWVRSIVEQCQAADVPVFVKQLGQRPTTTLPDGEHWPGHTGPLSAVQFQGDGFGNYHITGLKSRKGADPDEWPDDLRVRQFPKVPPC
jgi:protein gp37